MNKLRNQNDSPIQIEAEVAEGLEDVAGQEIKQKLGDQVVLNRQQHKGAVLFTYRGQMRELLKLRTVVALYVLVRYPVPRPKALLGHENFHRLVREITAIISYSPESYKTLRLSAAGSNTSVMRRLKGELAEHTGLTVDDDAGDLLLRIRRSKNTQTPGWDVLIRLTPRPLATRDWRVQNMEGALNASVAHAMVDLTHPDTADTFVNMACGSGTLLIERLYHSEASHVIGIDIAQDVLKLAQDNIAHSGLQTHVGLLCADATSTPLPPRCADAMSADLPFGQLVGSHADNTVLYPALLAEAARIAKPGCRFVIITHEVHLLETLLKHDEEWAVEEVRMVTLSGLHPRIFVLVKR